MSERSLTLLRIVGDAAVLSFLVAALTPAVNRLGSSMTPSRRAEPAQAIVVLGAGGVTTSGALTNTSLRHTMDTLALYNEGQAPIVVFSGEPDRGAGTEAEARASLARECGLPAPAIFTSSRAHTTREEAVQIRALLTPHGIRKIMLVADGPGLVRAKGVFEREGFDVVPAPWIEGLDLHAGPEDRLGLLRQLALELVARVHYRVAGNL